MLNTTKQKEIFTYSHFLKTNKKQNKPTKYVQEGKGFSVHDLKWSSPRANKLMSRLQRRIDQSREEEVRPHVPRVEGPLSEGGRARRRG